VSLETAISKVSARLNSVGNCPRWLLTFELNKEKGETWSNVYLYIYCICTHFSFLSLSTTYCICVFSCGFLITCCAPNNNNNSPKLIWTFPQLGLRWPVASLRRVYGVPRSSALRRWPPYGCQQE
jgi:hypothetical protein